jgi:hypothetical protein
MSFIDDMKIGKKLIGGFVIVLIIMAIIAAYGYTSAQDAAARSKNMYDNNMAAMEQMGAVSADFQQMRAELYRYIYVPSGRTAATTTIDQLQLLRHMRPIMHCSLWNMKRQSKRQMPMMKKPLMRR